MTLDHRLRVDRREVESALAPELRIIRTTHYARARFVADQAEAAAIAAGGAIGLVGSPTNAKWAVFQCPCGCGELLRVALVSTRSPAWRWRLSNSALSLYPSVCLMSGCCAHFVLSNGIAYIVGPKRPMRA